MAETFFSPCPRGLEAVLAQELQSLGGRELQPGQGGVQWRGDWTSCYRANLESRIATRVLWRVGGGRYRNESDIYQLAYSLPWAKWFSADDSIRIYVTAQRSPLKSLDFITLRVKDAVCDHFRRVSGGRPSVDTRQPDVRIHLFLTADRAMLYVDTSGAPLYKRGFKPAAVAAPLKENLAAGILRLSGWQPEQALVDPMCGSGTFLIEAAMMALDVAPGLGRRFAFERLRQHDAGAWAAVRRRAEDRRQSVRSLAIFGSDLVGEWVRRSRINLEAAGLAEAVQLEQIDLLELQPPAATGVMVSNPPYGVRVGESEQLAAFYPRLGDALKQRWSGWNCFFLSADTQLPKRIGLKASRRTPLFNGALECRLYEYRMVAGSNRRPPADEGRS